MSVLGIDFGDDSCYLAVARQGGIETLANDYSLRATPSCVAFTCKNRVMGVSAKQQTGTNLKNTVANFKHFIGKKFRDPAVQAAIPSLSYTVVETADGGVGMQVRYAGEDKAFSATQITAMLFTKLKLLAESALEVKVNDVCIGVPSFFDDASRQSVLAAASGAGLNVLRLLNETAATALAYGIYKQDLPGQEEKPRNVVFVDAGYSSLQVCAVAFNKGKLKILSTTFDENLGGKLFDRIIADHFVEEFKKKYKIDASTNKKAYLKLLSEVEKLKKQMSANSTQLPIGMECFMDDKDVQGRFSRADFEEMAAPLFSRVEHTLTSCLADSELSLEDIHSVEIVGGSSRVPAIKRLIEKVFGKSSSTTLNQDEAVARGCALQCAMLSPTFKVREFSIQDVQPYGIRLFWKDESGNNGDMEVFPKNHQVPFSKMMSFYRRSNFSLCAEYTKRGPGEEDFIGSYEINDVVPSADGGSQKVKVKVRINLNGNFLVSMASLTRKEEAMVEEQQDPKMEQSEKQEPAPAAADKKDDKMETAPPAETNDKDDAKEHATPKKVSRTIELPVVTLGHAFSPQQLNYLLEEEQSMAAADRLETDRINAKNAVEEYVYDLRSKLYEELEKYVAEKDRTELSKELNDTENWLYEEGDDCIKQVYLDRLDLLKTKGEPIKTRRLQRSDLPRAFEFFMTSVQLAQKVAQQYRLGDDKFAHIDPAEIEKVEKAVEERVQWCDVQMGALNATPNTEDVPVTVAQIQSQAQAFDAVVRPIVNKPKPKPKAATPPPADAKAPTAEGAEAEPQQEGASETAPPPQQQPMDVD